MIGKFAAAPMSLFGYGARNELGPLLQREGVKKALIVTDKVLDQLGIVNQITEVLTQNNIQFYVFNEVTPNPTLENVNAGANAYHANSCDFIVAIGGGSPNDCAKAIQVLVTNGGDIKDYQGGNKSNKRGCMIVAVNTTAGTASEVSRAYLISDEEAKQKLIFKDDYVMPSIAVNDTELMIGMPKSITAQTGMDALTHAIEALVSKNSFLLTDLFALQAIELIYTYLPIAVEEPHNQEAREAMAYGQYLAGLSFGSAGLGLIHAMAHQLGATYHLPHGLCNAVLLPLVMEFNQTACTEIFAKIADRLFPIETRCKSEVEKTNYVITKIKELSLTVGTTVSLTDLGVKVEDIATLADKTLVDGCIFSTPVMPTKEEVSQLFINLM